MNFDRVFKEIGEIGLYQKFVLFLTVASGPYVGFLFLNSVFVLEVPSHRCAIPGLSNDTFAVQSEYHQQLINQTIPQNDVCHVYSRDVQYDADNRPINGSLVPCTSWVYDKSIFEETLAAKLNLVCDRTIFKSNAQTIFFGGVLTGSLLSGILSDRFGRRLTCCVSTTLLVGAALALAWTPNYIYYAVFTYLVGTLVVGNFMTLFVMGMEFVGPPVRKHAGILGAYTWNIGLILLAWMGYSLRNWFHLQLACSIPGAVLLVYWWLLPESPRWLYSQGRIEESEKITKTIAKYNKTVLPEGFFKKLSQEDKEEEVPTGKIWHMFTSRRLALRTTVIFINWAVLCMTYYGLTLSSGNLGGDLFLNYALSVIVELPATIVTHIIIDYSGRRPWHVACMIVGGVACLATIFSSQYGGEDLQKLTTTLAMIGKLGSTAAYCTLFFYSAELFPTSVRNAGMGVSSSMARVGAMVAPYIADMGVLVESDFGQMLPMLLFGSLSVATGLLSLLLPETLNMHLPETIQDAENFGREAVTAEIKVGNGHINKGFDENEENSKAQSTVSRL